MNRSRFSTLGRAALALALVIGGTVFFASPAMAAPPVITAPNAVFGLPNTPLPFTGADLYSGDTRSITTNAQSTDANCVNLNDDGSRISTGCVVVYLALNNAGAGTISLNTAGLWISAGTVGSAGFQFNATAANAAAALATLVYTPGTDETNVPSNPATLKVDIRDGVSGETSGSPNGGVAPTTRYIAIRIADVNSAPVNTVPGAKTVAANSTTDYTGNVFNVADSDVEQEANDGMLLIMWLDCGHLSIAGGSLPIANDIQHLADFLVAQELNQFIANAVVAALPSAVTSLVLASSYTDVPAILGYGSLTEVQNALSTVTFHAPASAGTCTLNQLVTDVGNNGLPVLGGYVNLTDADNQTPTGYEIPDPLNLLDLDTVAFTVTAVAAVTVTINQGATQVDPVTTPGNPPTSFSPSVTFDVVFSEPVTGFDTGDLLVSGTASPGNYAVEDDGDGNAATYRVTVGQAQHFGTIIVSIPAGAATAGTNPARPNEASTSSDNVVLYADGTPDAGTQPTVTVTPGAAQADPTSTSPIVFDVVFSSAVVGFDTGDLSGAGTTAGGTLTYALTGSGATYTVSVSGMTTAGDVSLSVPADGAASDPAGALNLASAVATVGWTVSVPLPAPTVTVEQAAAQADPTSSTPLVFDIVFSQPVTGLTALDISTTATTAGGSLAIALLGSGTTYTASVTGMTTAGNVVLSLPAGAAQNTELTPSAASTSTDNTVAWVVAAPAAPTVTIDQAGGQADPTGTSPILFTVVFSEAVTGFTSADIQLAGTAGATTAVISGAGPTYTVTVTGMTGAGTVTGAIPAGAAAAVDDSTATASSTSTDASVTYVVAPTVTVNQALGQADPTGTSPILFTVVFSEAVTGFTSADIALSGTAGATNAVINGAGPIYSVTVSGMTSSGTVTVTIAAGAASATAAPALGTTASTSVDNTVTFTLDTEPPTTTPPTTTPPTTTPPTTTPPTTTPPTTTPPTGSATPSSTPTLGSGALAATGSTVAGLLPLSVVLLAAGLLLGGLARRPRRH